MARTEGDALAAKAVAQLAEHAAMQWRDWDVGEVGLRLASKVGTRGHPGGDPALRLLSEAIRRGRLPLAGALAGSGERSGEPIRVLDLSGTVALPLWAAEGARLRRSSHAPIAWTVALTSAADASAARAALDAAAEAGGGAPAVDLRLALPWEVEGAFDLVVWCPPAERGWRRVQAELLAVAARLAPGGTAWLLQDKDLGAKRTEREAGKHFAEVETLAREGGWRLSALRGALAQPPLPPDIELRFEAEDGPARAVVGTFAGSATDPGSELLLRGLPPELAAGRRVLDLGCGTGLLARRALRHGAAEVVALDDDLTAVRSTTWQLEAEGAAVGAALGRGSWRVLHSDLGLRQAEPGADPAGFGLADFDLVWCNPPFHVGRQVVGALPRAFLAAAALALRPGGELWMVANRALPYETELAAWSAWRDRTPAGEQRFKLLWARR